MKVASLFSGGKDSTYSIYKAKQEGHQIRCLITILPLSEESMLLHFPNIELTKLQSKSMGIPQIYIESRSNETETEVNLIEKILAKAKSEHDLEGLVHGGILSEFQKNIFDRVCSKLNLKLISPLWQKEQIEYMKNLIESNFHFIITSVSADGLDEKWLGKEITIQDLEKLDQLSKKYGFNINFEGGEAETIVIDCPLFSHPIMILKSRKIWDGIRGRFEILDAELDYRAR
ncbi:MAG: diphthine--ammonia ligase [Thaumarchaeota archaeon]|nr:diphthine--ammonia ligase [Nitrososphaerota archaeon]